MELANFVRSKKLPNEDTFQLLAILRNENVVEELIDFIVMEKLKKISKYEEDIEYRDEKIRDLKLELESHEKYTQDKKDDLELDDQLKSESLTDLLGKFEEENGRHPSIEETWETAWNGCKEKYDEM